MRGPVTVFQGAALLVGLLLPGSMAGSAATLDTDVARYRDATGLRVTVRGRAFEERRRSGGAEEPLTGTAVTLVPRSEAFLRRLAELKATSRASVDAYTRTASAIRHAREAYERALWKAGAADLAHARVVTGDGTFAFDGVAPGAWVLMGWRSVSGNEHVAGRQVRKESRRFAPTSRVATHQTVTVWLRELSVGPEGSEVELTDRNVWFSGLVEVLTPGAAR